MSELFEPARIGSLELKNRFVHSATFECLAQDDGRITPELIKRYKNLARGEVGLIIPGHIYVHPRGKAFHKQIGIHHDAMISGLAELCAAIHAEGGKVAFQLAHGGRQAPKDVMGQAPLAPSGHGRDPASLDKPRAMSQADIAEVVAAYAAAAGRAKTAGADAVQIHGAHGYLIDEFLSPFFNRRDDQWGGSAEKRFRLLREIYSAVRGGVGPDIPVLVKLNSIDHTPKPGITPELAKQYVAWLVEMGIDGVELSCGTYYSFHMARGQVPLSELARTLPAWMRPIAKLKFRSQIKPCAFEPLYNLPAANEIQPALGSVPLLLVGGVRKLSEMERVVQRGQAQFISLSRPLIREPFLVKRLRQGKTSQAACISCNKCFAAIYNQMPLRCYVDGLPEA